MAKKNKKEVTPKEEVQDKDTEQDSEIAALKARLDAAETRLASSSSDTSNPTVSGKINQETGDVEENIGEEEYLEGEGAGQGNVPTYAGRDQESPAPEPEKELPV